MTTKRAAERPRRPRGRPPKGVRPGETVTSYHRLTVRLPVDAKARLLALADVTGTPAWLLVTKAVDLLWKELSADRRDLAHRLAEVKADHLRADEDVE
jgi:hypothetical protein